MEVIFCVLKTKESWSSRLPLIVKTRSYDLNNELMNLIHTAPFCNMYSDYFVEMTTFQLEVLTPGLEVPC